MDHFSGARYPAYTMRRFYPAMYGKNLTFQPSQYGGPTDAATEAAPATGGSRSVWSSIGGFFADPEVAGGIGTAVGGVTKYYMSQSTADRDLKRQMQAAESQARIDESRARVAALQSKGAGSESNALLWVGGGIMLLALLGGGVYFATRK
jgi:hypothetical protein